MGLLTGRVVLVTGSGRGVGAAIARVLAAEGAAVGVNYSASEARAREVVEAIRSRGGTAEALQGDVRDAAQMEACVQRLRERCGKIDGVVNNAIAGRQHCSLDDAAPADYAGAFDFGCLAVLNTLKAVRTGFREQGGGRIVNIVTELWNMAPAGWTVYMAGKGAMVGMSRSLAAELGPENIAVNMVAPGWMVDEKVDPASAGSRQFAETLPLRRHGSADEIGKACAFFLSDLATYITGAYLPVTGGRITQMGA